MKVLNHVAVHGQKSWMKAVEREDGPIVELSNRMTLNNHQLKEILLMPQDAPAITEQFLAKIHLHTVDDLLAIYQGQKAMYRDHVYLVKYKILGHFFTNLPWQDALWYFSILDTDNGPVISVTVGNRIAMDKMFEKEKNRKRPRALVLQV